MTPKQNELKKHYIKLVHTLKKDFFIDDDARYMYMQAKFNKDSLTKLSIDELRVMLEDMGYKPYKKGKIPKQKAKNEEQKATQKQLDTIVGIWNTIARNKTKLALGLFCERITGYLMINISSLSKKEASKVIIALKKMQKEYFNGKIKKENP
ncbi:DUF1018 domain-containing protein [Campylobacter blaseri]|uniref:DUF1018 domain-containing protein n=1 Tax=Campylobacter blaseri TaxID=2042961 RepID=A0A2P8R2N2_9BACT|nr:phage protein GemA/Gp16 family protein [Campylobacter blaseri]PSM52774.1 hypothetical protein CQ405_03355 [Campylobacter blaseri]PSM54422.1 hypothetical protein CRN67_03355 [Campylobacter blaseri]QKF86087.1 DUF1018 domain-containing protein [Campylobacter blaseri]